MNVLFLWSSKPESGGRSPCGVSEWGSSLCSDTASKRPAQRAGGLSEHINYWRLWNALYVGHQRSCLLPDYVNLSPDVNAQTAIYQWPGPSLLIPDKIPGTWACIQHHHPGHLTLGKSACVCLQRDAVEWGSSVGFDPWKSLRDLDTSWGFIN